MKTCHNRLPSFFADVQSEFDHVLKHVFGGKPSTTSTVQPRGDIVETEAGFEVMLDLPGVARDEISVEVNDGRLVIEGSRKELSPGENETLHRRERWSGAFRREFEFPVDVDFEKVSAEFELGVLTILLPKSEKAKPRKIEVRVAE